MQDTVFGKLDWDSNLWEGSVSLPFFRSFGKDMPTSTQDPSDPPDPWA